MWVCRDWHRSPLVGREAAEKVGDRWVPPAKAGSGDRIKDWDADPSAGSGQALKGGSTDHGEIRRF